MRRPPRSSRLGWTLALSVVAVLCSGDVVQAGRVGTEILLDHRAWGDWFGMAVAGSGDTAVIGSPVRSSERKKGSAYVYERAGSDWTGPFRLRAPSGSRGDQFGKSVAIDGDTIVVGAPADDDGGANGGAAYVFERESGGWALTQQLLSADVSPGDALGISVAVSGDTIVVGSLTPGAYVFRRGEDGWTEEATLVGSSLRTQDAAFSVAVDGGTVAVGSTAAVGDLLRSGAAFVFVRSAGARAGRATWRETTRLISPSERPDERFGSSVSVRKRTLVVGASGESRPTELQGRAFVYRKKARKWTLATTLTGDGSTDGSTDYFGLSVATNGKQVVVGAPWEDVGGDDNGATYLFKRRGSGWVRRDKLLSTFPNSEVSEFLGWSVAFANKTILVGGYGAFAQGHGKACGGCGGAIAYR